MQRPGPFLVVVGKDPNRKDASMFWFQKKFPCYIGEHSLYRIDQTGVLYRNDQMMPFEVVESDRYNGPRLHNVQNLTSEQEEQLNNALFGSNSVVKSPIKEETQEKNTLYWIVIALIILLFIGIPLAYLLL